jgi:very-short-patch-repair endonuclease
MTARPKSGRGEVLVAIMNNKRDFGILQEHLWYRIPVDKAPRRWPPKWLAFYQIKVFGEERWSVRYYGLVRDIRVRKRKDLFPNELPNPKSDKEYYQLRLHSLDQLPHPLHSEDGGHRIVFVPTTESKFFRARDINDIFDDSPLEERAWAELKSLPIRAERQWNVVLPDGWYRLDFAIFCASGKIDVETDGVHYHTDPERWAKDRRRDRKLQLDGWKVMRFTGQEVRESLLEYCVPEITQMINKLGGPEGEGIVSRTFHDTPDGLAQQLTLFEDEVDYDLD